MIHTLRVIKNQMESLGVPYAHKRWIRKPEYPYFVGRYRKTGYRFEDGCTTGTVTIDGWERGGSCLKLLEITDQITEHFESLQIIEESRLFSICCSMAEEIPVPEGDGDLHHVVIRLDVSSWKGVE